MKNDVLKDFALKAKRRLVGKENIPLAKIKVISNEDEDFKNRVKSLLSRDELIANPVQYLIDDKIFNSLTESERERYLLSTLDKYSLLREQLENNNPYTKFCM